MTPTLLCEGIGLPICAECFRNVEHHPGTAPRLKPKADPPRCADWQPVPVRTRVARHKRDRR